MRDDLTSRYLRDLKAAMKEAGADPAVIQDALFDAGEFFDSTLEGDTTVEQAIDEFGSPAEVTTAYLAAEDAVARALGTASGRDRGLLAAPDTRTWAAVAYLLLSLGTGIAYFAIALVGVSLSVTLAVFIVGIPVFLLFIGVVRSVSLVEGRIIEALLGVRMPRRPLLEPAGGWLDRFKHWLSDRRTWTTIVYMAGQLPLGIAYFGMVVFGAVIATWLVVGPWLQAFAGVPFLPDVNGAEFFLEGWAVIPASAAGVLMFFVLFAAARLVGRIHSRYAKWMLVGSLGQER